jgi:hypothetical protein
MPRIPKRLLALGGLAAGGAAFLRRRRGATATAPNPAPAPAPAPAAAPAPPPPAPAADVAPAAPVAPPPPPPAEAPAPARPVVHTDDDFVAAEEAAAAAEARNIGGPRLDDAHGDEAMEPVYEAGGGEAEGFEAAEDALIENATHAGGRADPIGDAFTAEVESDEATVVDGEADEERVSELGEDETDRR